MRKKISDVTQWHGENIMTGWFAKVPFKQWELKGIFCSAKHLLVSLRLRYLSIVLRVEVVRFANFQASVRFNFSVMVIHISAFRTILTIQQPWTMVKWSLYGSQTKVHICALRKDDDGRRKNSLPSCTDGQGFVLTTQFRVWKIAV